MAVHSMTSEPPTSLLPALPDLQAEKYTFQVWHPNPEGRDPVFPQQPYPYQHLIRTLFGCGEHT